MLTAVIFVKNLPRLGFSLPKIHTLSNYKAAAALQRKCPTIGANMAFSSECGCTQQEGRMCIYSQKLARGSKFISHANYALLYQHNITIGAIMLYFFLLWPTDF